MGLFRDLVSRKQQEKNINGLSPQAQAIVNMVDNPKHLPKLNAQPDKVQELTNKLLLMSQLQQQHAAKIAKAGSMLDNQTAMYMNMLNNYSNNEQSMGRRR